MALSFTQEIFLVWSSVHLLLNIARAANMELGLLLELDGTGRITVEGLPVLFTGVMDISQVGRTMVRARA